VVLEGDCVLVTPISRRRAASSDQKRSTLLLLCDSVMYPLALVESESYSVVTLLVLV
jgi:hypothetical protein